ncbi:glycosyl hydrolase family 47-domain-containing protein [Podospora appendiculata]|uniref:alpha-1,2-Mannosidase n=1 Tax=Podospora appendiculata TaxID=314037 RepID=A0AAE1CDH7_9PEZI|nr:glycosyl hydrolase family 47-domain-containing protein [Podospora appendiculata]
MLRLRRYRVFIICAVVITLLLYHVSKNSQWERLQSSTGYEKVVDPRPKSSPPKKGALDNAHKKPPTTTTSTRHRETTVAAYIPKKEPTVRIPQLKTSNEVKGGYVLPTAAPTTAPTTAKANNADAAYAQPQTQTTAAVGLPDRAQAGVSLAEPEDIHAWHPPAKNQGPSATSTIHWRKPHEWFPIPAESLIPLPSGKPKALPSVQFAFGEESPQKKEKRERRLAKVKAEAERAWSGYKKYAWGHDELTPVSKTAKDPFCGWAATLVDAMDTLWIMGMKDEFDDAVLALKNIDFTTTPYRHDIPVFETIIRYLGGLLGAYDVSGGAAGKYRVLLDKAVELAEVLMSVFDTPNRMPMLYYQWQPAYNENPRLAPVNSGIAEMGSMGLEFTRLAQLTGETKYYDAIARITNALEEFQNREDASAIPGIFPQQIDASGCNTTEAALATLKISSDFVQMQAEKAVDLSGEPKGYTPNTPKGDYAPAPSKDNEKDIEFRVTPGSRAGDAGTGSFHQIEKEVEGRAATERGRDSTTGSNNSSQSFGKVQKRDAQQTATPAPLSAKGLPVDWKCVPQNLTAGGWGTDHYSMGGSQDSAYEYFPKLYALLGGLEPKYKAMHEKTVDAVKKHLLFRPMAEGDPDILFSGKATKSSRSDRIRYEYEVTHLTCFLGGMFGLGGKLFDSPQDVEIGKRLADGCAWAYEVMPTGIMPEYAMALPCEVADDCHWNRTAWYDRLDPNASFRASQMEEYYANKAEWELQVDKLKKQEAYRLEAEEKERRKQAAIKQAEEEDRRLRPENNTLPGEEAPTKLSLPTQNDNHDLKDRDNVASPIGKRDLSGTSQVNSESTSTEKIEQKVKTLENELDLNSNSGRQSSNADASDQKPMYETIYPPEPHKPVTHEEYVAQRLKDEKIPPGFVSLNDPRYILRPEAIESVWIMYRITGDPSWQEKGWRMFEAVIRATQTDVGHSAISDVTVTAPTKPTMLDSMESFWLAETLKYFYLLFSTPDVISLDEWVFNTEAHPLRRPR